MGPKLGIKNPRLFVLKILVISRTMHSKKRLDPCSIKETIKRLESTKRLFKQVFLTTKYIQIFIYNIE